MSVFPAHHRCCSESNVKSCATLTSSGWIVQELALQDLQAWAATKLPPYQVPKVLKRVDSIPRNAMGKVNKKQLKSELFG